MNKVFLIDDKILFNYEESTLTIEGEETRIRHQCCELLMLFIKCYELNTYLTFQEIGDTIWYDSGGWGKELKPRIKDCVADLRNLLGDANYIQNIRQRGYKFSCCSLVKQSTETNFQIGKEENGGSNFTSGKVSDQVGIKCYEILQRYKILKKDLIMLEQGIVGVADIAHEELSSHKVLSDAYRAKQLQTSFVIKDLALELKNLNSLICEFEKVEKQYELDSWVSEDIQSHHFSAEQADDLLNKLKEIGKKKAGIEFRTDTCQNRIFLTFTTYKREEKLINRIINFFLRKASQKFKYKTVDDEVFDASYYYFSDIQKHIKTKNEK